MEFGSVAVLQKSLSQICEDRNMKKHDPDLAETQCTNFSQRVVVLATLNKQFGNRSFIDSRPNFASIALWGGNWAR